MKQKKAKGDADKRKKILRAAMKLFLEKGYDGATTNQICARAKVARPTLYYYADSKRDLFYQLHMEAIEKDLKPHLIRLSAIEDPLLRLKRMVEEFARLMCIRPELRVLIHDTLAMKDEYFREVRHTWKEHYSLLKNTIGELQEKGSVFASEKASRLALFSLGTLVWISFWYDYRRKEGSEEVVAAAAAVVLRALLKRETCPFGTHKETIIPGLEPSLAATAHRNHPPRPSRSHDSP